MYTQCPDCKKTYLLGADPVPGNNLLAYCSVCQKEFNALEYLSETSADDVDSPKEAKVNKAESANKPKAKPKKKRKSRSQSKAITAEQPTALANDQAQTEMPPAVVEESPASIPALDLKPGNELIVPLQPAEKTAIVLNNTVASVDLNGQTYEALPWEIRRNKFNINWQLGAAAGFILLIGQLIYFEADDMAQSVTYRPYLEKICHRLNCRLQAYTNLNEFAVMKGSFKQNGNNSVNFKAVINNQAPFSQSLPKIKLTLLDYEERIFAQRLFGPNDYLTAAGAHKTSIASDESVEVQLNIIAPKLPIGGYYFDLIY